MRVDQADLFDKHEQSSQPLGVSHANNLNWLGILKVKTVNHPNFRGCVVQTTRVDYAALVSLHKKASQTDFIYLMQLTQVD